MPTSLMRTLLVLAVAALWTAGCANSNSGGGGGGGGGGGAAAPAQATKAGPYKATSGGKGAYKENTGAYKQNTGAYVANRGKYIHDRGISLSNHGLAQAAQPQPSTLPALLTPSILNKPIAKAGVSTGKNAIKAHEANK